ncbi:DUF397 domain-containing protein [Streptomyces sp. NPDC048441]|uniref:DUF397 domain-containing protein n=1 Tax=Streptomyces sp. NPDC048441 TaxID=3365552 RepID=UPI003716D839
MTVRLLFLATAPDGTLRLRESDDPGRILGATREGLAALLTAIKESPGGSY